MDAGTAIAVIVVFGVLIIGGQVLFGRKRRHDGSSGGDGGGPDGHDSDGGSDGGGDGGGGD